MPWLRTEAFPWGHLAARFKQGFFLGHEEVIILHYVRGAI